MSWSGKLFVILSVLGSLLWLTPSATATIVVTVSPSSVAINPGAQQQFSSQVTGTGEQVVTWSLSGSGCIGIACGHISGSGLYTAPTTIPIPNQVTVIATSLADSSVSGSATVSINTPIVVKITPTLVQLNTGAQQQFSASVTGSSDTAVTWSVSSAGCTGAACGTVTSSGLYTAPGAVPNPAGVNVIATSQADPTKSASATVVVQSPVAITISPASANVPTAGQQQFTATVTGTNNTAVTWSLSGAGCSGSACGTLSSSGLYTAPTTVPNPPTVSVTATSQADTTKFATATVTIILVQVSVSPSNAQVVTGTQQQFTATVTGTVNQSVTWTLSGAGCSGSACGTITTAGLYTAPSTVPTPATVTVTATSKADTSKSGTATVTVVAPISVSVSPATAQVVAGAQQQFTATVTGTVNQSVTWSLSGAGCSGSTCGTITSAGLYTAPSTVPTPATVTVTATSKADTSKSGTATVTVVAPISVSVSPATAQVVSGAQQQFTATVTGTSNQSVTWSLSGAGCSGSACGTITTAGLYTAPSTVPNPAKVTVTATSQADTSKSGTATVIVIPAILVTVSPGSAKVATGAQQQFTATVTGTTNQAVTWSLSGSGCTGAACGTITSVGLYTAPASIPNPATVAVIATSQADPSKSGTGIVTVVPPVIVSVSPATAQVLEGAQQQFTATVSGTSNTSVTWNLAGTGCTGVACGTITGAGLYTAPNKLPNPPTVAVIATSQADPSKLGTATVTVLPPVVVTISPTSARVFAGDTKRFTATVTGTTNTAVSWNVSGTGCSGLACGTVDNSGLYTAPSTVPTPSTVTVTATSQANPTKSASAVVTILAAVSVGMTPGNAVVTVGRQLQFNAQVSGTSNRAVTWEISGTGCTPARCGTISSAGIYSAPATVPSPATVQILAVSAADPQRSGTATVTIVAADTAKLNGAYVFLFRGFDSSGPYISAGSFTADGHGNILNGLEDVNRTSGPVNDIPFTGTYSLTPDNRGVLTITTASGSSTFAFALGATGQIVRFIEFDTSGVRGSGILKARTVSPFSDSTLNDVYVLGVTGAESSSARVGVLGTLFFNGSGGISGSELDVNDGGNVLPTFINFPGNYSIDATGRGTVALFLSGFASNTLHFAVYVVSSTDVILVSTDPFVAPSPMLSGELFEQASSLPSASTLQGPTIFGMTGVSQGFADAAIGQMSFDGHSTATMLFDENSGGMIANGQLAGGYNVLTTGRTNVNLVNFKTHTSTTLIAYVIADNTAFLMDTTASVRFGALQTQLAAPPFTNGTLLGAFALAPDLAVLSGPTLAAGVLSFDGVSAVTGTEDTSQTSGLSSGVSVAGTYAVSTSLNNGRGQLNLVSPAPQNMVLWIVSNSQFVGLDIDPTNTSPTVLVVSQ